METAYPDVRIKRSLENWVEGSDYLTDFLDELDRNLVNHGRKEGITHHFLTWGLPLRKLLTCIGVVAVFLHPWIKYSLCLMLKGY